MTVASPAPRVATKPRPAAPWTGLDWTGRRHRRRHRLQIRTNKQGKHKGRKGAKIAPSKRNGTGTVNASTQPCSLLAVASPSPRRSRPQAAADSRSIRTSYSPALVDSQTVSSINLTLSRSTGYEPGYATRRIHLINRSVDHIDPHRPTSTNSTGRPIEPRDVLNMAEDLKHIQQLTGQTSYDLCSVQIKAVLKSKRVWDYVQGSVTETIKNTDESSAAFRAPDRRFKGFRHTTAVTVEVDRHGNFAT